MVSRLNQDFNRIFAWANFNKVLFDAEKFHILDVGINRIARKHRKSAVYGSCHPSWDKSAKYLGVILDEKFTFINHITNVIERIESSLWRIFNHSNYTNGSSPYTLLFIFRTWLLPIIDYGSCLWIFSVFDGTVTMNSRASRGYVTVFKKLSGLYARICKSILGVPSSTCTVAVYVRLGILPLRYHLSLRALVWYLRCYHGKASQVVQKQLFHLYSHDEDWMNTCFINLVILC